jgi:hypothetical protein
MELKFMGIRRLKNGVISGPKLQASQWANIIHFVGIKMAEFTAGGPELLDLDLTNFLMKI